MKKKDLCNSEIWQTQCRVAACSYCTEGLLADVITVLGALARGKDHTVRWASREWPGRIFFKQLISCLLETH